MASQLAGSRLSRSSEPGAVGLLVLMDCLHNHGLQLDGGRLSVEAGSLALVALPGPRLMVSVRLSARAESERTKRSQSLARPPAFQDETGFSFCPLTPEQDAETSLLMMTQASESTFSAA